MTHPHPKPWFKRFSRIGLVALILSLVAIVVSGPGYRAGLLELGKAFQLSMASGALALAALVSAVIAVILGRIGTPKLFGRSNFLIIVVTVAFLATLGSWAKRGKELPVIHDISTDLDNPPAFVDIAPLRADAPNPAAYAGPETAALQREAYADIQPIMLNASVGDIVEAARESADKFGWEIVASDPAVGRLEATHTSFWYGYKDDIVVRVSEAAGKRRLDIRSKSRLGRSDLGANAARIREYSAAILARVD